VPSAGLEGTFHGEMMDFEAPGLMEEMLLGAQLLLLALGV
jgi:hypothetical protein